MSKINDILELAVKKNIRINNSSDFGDADLNTLKTQVDSANASAAAALAAANGVQRNWTTYHGGYNIPSPNQLMTGAAGVITVGETTTYSSANGCCCLWTVPAGVTQAQFQIWGAGGNGDSCNASVCCAFSQSGGNGEYTYVLMGVQAGQQYTLCAGGGIATTMGNCYSYCAYDGCNSFVCGANDTCILSCGGSMGYANLCGNGARNLYPSNGNNYATTQAATFICTGMFQCQQYFSNPIYRYDGTCVGGVASNNSIRVQAKIPSLVWGVAQCGSSICYMCQRNYTIMPDHTICLISCGWQGSQFSGCCANAYSATFRKPGLGGPGMVSACVAGPTHGACGNSGLVIVTYK